MAQQSYEIVFLGDFRDPDFESTTSDLIQAAVSAGYRTGLVQLAHRQASLPAMIHRAIGDMIASGRVEHLDPNQTITSKLLIITDPRSFLQKPRRALRIEASLNVILLPYGPTTLSGQELYDWATVHNGVMELLSGEIVFAPMSPFVRAQMKHMDPWPSLSEGDWHTCIDPDKWQLNRTDFCGTRPVIGRSGPPLVESWPTSAPHILSLYPDDPQVLVRLLNGGAVLKKQIGRLPRTWDVLTPDTTRELDFLSSIDFFVHSHHPDFIGPIDPYLLRAMATGAVAVLPQQFEEIFGDGAIYAAAEEITSSVLQLYNDRMRCLM